MTRSDTVRRVLAWAIDPSGRPPSGTILGMRGQVGEFDAVAGLVAELCAATTARLGLGDPTAGDRGPIGVGPVILALVIGARSNSEVVSELLLAAPPSTAPQDRIARHGLLLATASHERVAGIEALFDDLLRASPLSRILLRPPAGGLIEPGLLRMLVGCKSGRRCLVRQFAEPSTDTQVLMHRAETLELLRDEFADVVLDVYSVALSEHYDWWRRAVVSANRELAMIEIRPSEWAIAIGKFFAVLSRQRQSDRESVDQRIALDARIDPILETVKRHNLHRSSI